LVTTTSFHPSISFPIYCSCYHSTLYRLRYRDSTVNYTASHPLLWLNVGHKIMCFTTTFL
jgi:hypothetical protein